MFTRNKNNTELVSEVDLLPADVLVVCRQKVVVGRGRVEATQAGNQLEMGGKEGETVALKKSECLLKNAFEIFVISNRKTEIASTVHLNLCLCLQFTPFVAKSKANTL